MILNQNEFVPTNGQILLEEIQEETKETEIELITLKSSKKKEQEKLKIYKILAVAHNVQSSLRESGKGRIAIVESAMVEDFVCGDLKLKIVHERYVYGIFVSMKKY